jgi:hypothetical protein
MSRHKTRSTPGRDRRSRFLVLCVSLALVTAGCRARRIWTGVEFQPDGKLRVAAEEPMCGCLSVVNAGNDEVRLRATQRMESIGQAVLKPAARLRYRFDWGGPQNDDSYEIVVTTPDGRPLDADKALEVEERPRWVECEAAACEVGDLHMDAAVKEQ